MISHSRQVFDATSADQYHRVFLQIMTDARDVGIDFISVRQPHARYLAQGRVGLLRCGGFDLGTDTTFLWRPLQSRCTYLIPLLDPRIADELIYRRHLNSRDVPFRE